MAAVNKIEKANKLSQVQELISKGKTRGEIIAFCEEELGMTKRSAIDYYRDALRELIMDDDFLGDYKKAIQAQNYDRLEKIVNDTINGNAAEKKVCISAIAELNKMTGSGGNSVTIGKNQEGEEIIHITFEH